MSDILGLVVSIALIYLRLSLLLNALNGLVFF